MSVSKFLAKNTVLIRSSYDFIRSSFIKDSIIFIDEFDDSKNMITNHIIDMSYKTEEDYLDLFHQLYMNMNEELFDTDVKQSLLQVDKTEERKESRYESLKKEAADIVKKYHLDLNYKTTGDSEEGKPKFLFFDGNLITSADDERTVRAKYNRMDIFYTNFYEYSEETENPFVDLEELLDKLHEFFYHFRLLILEWAKAYAERINSLREEKEDLFEEDNALSSLLGCFKLNEKQKEFFYNEINQVKKPETIKDKSFYLILSRKPLPTFVGWG